MTICLNVQFCPGKITLGLGESQGNVGYSLLMTGFVNFSAIPLELAGSI